MKKLYIVAALLLVLGLALGLVACDQEPPAATPDTGTEAPGTPDTPSTPDTPADQEMTGVSFTGATYDYDGTEKKIEVVGAPAGASVVYSNNKGTDAGQYNATAVITCEGYVTKTLTATLKINKAPHSSTLQFNGASFEYDTQKHVITVTGNVPVGATVTYTGGEDGKNGATTPGNYTVTVTVTHKNYTTFTASASLKITSKVEPLSVVFAGNKIFFQNSLDKDYMYRLDASGPVRVSRDKPVSAVTVGSKVYYLSKGALSSGIYSFDPATGNAEGLLEVSADMIVTDGVYLYYNVNNLLKSENNGIYRVSIADLENSSIDPTPVRLAAVKTDSMTVTDNYVYFSNKNDGGKLYAIHTAANNGTAVKIYDHKVSELINDGEKIYFVRAMAWQNVAEGAAIYAINVDGGLNTLQNEESEKVIRITVSNGKYLTVVNDYVYFLNTDLGTTNVFGDGIYRAKKDGSGWITGAIDHLMGSAKVVDGTADNIFALTSDGEALYYFRTSTRHLYCFDFEEESEDDLMEGFVPPVYKEPILTYYEKAQEVNGSIYYINMLDGGKLWRYDIASQMDVRITQMAVADFLVCDNVLYYATTRFLVNFDLYRMSLLTGEPERISTQKCMNFSVVDGKLYYTNYSSSNTLNCMDLTTLEDTVIFDEKGVSAGETVVYDGYVYFVANDQLYRYSLSTKTAALVNKNLKPLEYLIYNGKILMMNTDGMSNSVGVYDIATDTYHKIDGLGLSGVSQDVRGLFVYNGDMYYYRNIATGTSEKGLYKVVYSNGEYSATLVDKFDGYYLCESMVVGNKVYFMDVWQIKDSLPTTTSTAKLCVLDMTSKQITTLN